MGKITTIINPYVGYRIGKHRLWGLSGYAKRAMLHIATEADKGNKWIQLSREERFFSKIPFDNIVYVMFPEQHPGDISKCELKQCIRFLSREKAREGKTYSLGDLRIKIEGGYAWLWKSQVEIFMKSSIREHLKSAGIYEFANCFSPSELDKLFLTVIDNAKYDYKKLRETYSINARIPLIEAFENVRVFSHLIETLKSLERIRKAGSCKEEELRDLLRKRGNPIEVDENGISGSAFFFQEFSKILEELKYDPRFYKIFLASLWLHDLGKIIAEEDHPSLSADIIRTNKEIRKNLLSILNQEEIEFLAFIVGYHSTIADVAITREANHYYLFNTILSAPGSKEQKKKMVKALMLLSICDVDAYNRLSVQRISDMFEFYKYLLRMIEEEKSIEDFKKMDLNKAFGQVRFDAWTVKEGAKFPEIERAAALEELESVYPNGEDRRKFYQLLGQIEIVGSIYDLRREITDPKLRARLLICLASLMEKYLLMGGYNQCRFCLTRDIKAVFKAEVLYITHILQNLFPEIMKSPHKIIEDRFNLAFDGEKKNILISIPLII